MKYFLVRWVDHGVLRHSRVCALTRDDARNQIKGPVIDVRRARGVNTVRVNLPVLLQEMVALLEAGLEVVEVVEALHDSAAPGGQRDMLAHIKTSLHEGQPFSQALKSQPVHFPALLVASVAASERTGGLADTLRRYNAYALQMTQLRKRVRAVLMYPGIVITLALLVLAFLLGVVVPRFAAVLDTGHDAPETAGWMIAWTRLLDAHGMLIAAAAVGIPLAMFLAWRRPANRVRLATTLCAIPFIARFARLFELTRFYRSTGLLLSGGVDIIDALSWSSPLLSIERQAQLTKAVEDIRAGIALAEALERAGLTTPVAVRLLSTGQRSGNIDAMCERIAAFQDDTLSQAIDTFSRIFEPAVMLVVGLLIGAVVFLLYMPIFDLSGSIPS